MPRSLTAVGLWGAVAAAGGVAEASAEGLGLACSEALLAGVYGFNFDTLADPDTGRAEAGTGLLQLLENGRLRLKTEGFREGEAGPFMSFERGRWEVEADCSGALELRSGALWTFVAVENGNELHLISARLLEEAEAKRLFRR